MDSDLETRIRHVTAVLGPTNTGKTHLAIERMLGHESGLIGLPLRLLAREVYDKICKRCGSANVALITGEEKIKPERARYWVATVEAMPRDVDVDFLAIDEVQLAADVERGHVFTDRMLNARGRSETLLLGAQTMRDAIQDLIPGANFISRPRLSKLSYAGEKKITRLPARSAVVAFSANDVYSIAELIRRQRGGAAVVLGALSPRTRNAQVALYQSGDVDFLVATDAIGMGLNLDVDHVAFSATRKFDGQNHRDLTPSELSQIAGRAGRHMNDGTFGVTGSAQPLDAETIERLETHTFDPVKVLQWRSTNLDFSSLKALRDSLRQMPSERRLVRARNSDDVDALEAVSRDEEIVKLASSPAAVTKLWEVCQVPDYRKISSQNHADLIASLYKFVAKDDGHIDADWFAKQVAFADRTDGDIDTLANRIAHIRTWTFVSNRIDWLADPLHWQGRTKEIEDALSDALHERLTQRFVDRRTSALMKGMRDKDELSAVIGDDGAVSVEDHFVGRLQGFRFLPDTQSDSGVNGKAMRNAAAQVLSGELAMRARRAAAAKADAFKLERDGRIFWRGEEIAQLEASDDPLKPTVNMQVDEHLSVQDRDKVLARLSAWVEEIVGERLKPLADLKKAEDVSGLARGVAYRLVESFGILKRESVASEIKELDQTARAQLRKYGVRFGAFNVYFPLLLKPAPAELAATLWNLKHAAENGLELRALPEPPRAGLTSVVADAEISETFYRANGFHLCGPRAVRLDILERLADQIRPLLAWRAGSAGEGEAPDGSTGDGGFKVTPAMMSILGCSPDELGSVLKSLGFRLERRPLANKQLGSRDQDDGGRQGEQPTAVATGESSADVDQTKTSVEPSETSEKTSDTSSLQDTESGVEVQEEGETAPSASLAKLASDGTDPADAEPQFEEIWRPRKGRSGGRRRERNRRGGQAGRHAGGGQENKTAAGSDDAKQKEGSSAGHSGAGNGASRNGGERGRGATNANGGRSGWQGKGAKADRSGKSAEHRGGKRRKGQRGDKRGAFVQSSAPSRKGADPDSPFAALGVLKDALQKRQDDDGS